MDWNRITWMAPSNSIFFILFGVALLVLAYRWHRFYALLRQLGKPVGNKRFLYNVSMLRITIKNCLWGLGLLLLFSVLLRPCWNKKEHAVTQEGRDVFIALDISRSMLAQDVTPNRLTFAKEKITSLVHALASERLGLILFSGSSFIQCPLTKDISAFLLYLNQIDTDTVGSGKTAVQEAISHALRAFEESGTKKNKLLIIVTDGEDFSHDLASLKDKARQEGLTIFTIGIGTSEGAPIPLFNAQGKQTGHLRDKNGTVIISSLNDQTLQALATDLGGIYIHATPNADDLRSLIRLVEMREKEQIEQRSIAQLEEQYPIFLFVSFILFALEWLL
jgi:Ca-activated chloride channel family protein